MIMPASHHFFSNLRPTDNAVSLSIDDFVGTRQYNAGHGKTKGLCGLEVERHFVPVRRLHREIARRCAPKNAIDVICGMPELIEKSRPIGDEATGDNMK